MLEKVIKFSIQHRWLTVLLTLACGALGVLSFRQLPIDAVPDITNNQVQINTLAAALSPEQVEKRVTFPVETALAEFATNGISTIALMTALAPRMEAQRHGALAVISSVAGDRGRQSNYLYGAAKAAVSTFASGLRQRLAKVGVNVLTIKPGFVDTPMTRNFRKGVLWAKPEAIARGIVRAADRGRSVVYLPGFWLPIMLIIRHIPEFIFKRIKL